jgi:hypothetical protein
MKTYKGSRDLNIILSPGNRPHHWEKKIHFLVRKKVYASYKNIIHGQAKRIKKLKKYLKIKDIEKKIRPSYKKARAEAVERAFKKALTSKWALEIKKRMGLVPKKISDIKYKNRKEYKDFPMSIDKKISNSIWENVNYQINNNATYKTLNPISEDDFNCILFLVLYEWVQLLIINYRKPTIVNCFCTIKNYFSDCVLYFKHVKEKIKLDHCVWKAQFTPVFYKNIIKELNKNNLEFAEYKQKQKLIVLSRFNIR